MTTSAVAIEASLLLEFSAVGMPQPAGSKSIGRTKDGRAFVRHANDAKQRPWRQEVARSAADAMAGRPLLDGPVRLRVTFFRPRPTTHFKSTGGLSAAGNRAEYPTARPDVTKLVRALEDALKGIAWRDDAQVVMLEAVKLWGEPARAMVEVHRA